MLAHVLASMFFHNWWKSWILMSFNHTISQLRRKIELDPLFAPQTTNVRNKVSRNIATELLQTVEHRNIDDTII